MIPNLTIIHKTLGMFSYLHTVWYWSVAATIIQYLQQYNITIHCTSYIASRTRCMTNHEHVTSNRHMLHGFDRLFVTCIYLHPKTCLAIQIESTSIVAATCGSFCPQRIINCQGEPAIT